MELSVFGTSSKLVKMCLDVSSIHVRHKQNTIISIIA